MPALGVLAEQRHWRLTCSSPPMLCELRRPPFASEHNPKPVGAKGGGQGGIVKMRFGAFSSSGLNPFGSLRCAPRPKWPAGHFVEQGFVHRSPMRQSIRGRKGPLLIGGQGGIRTPGTVTRTPHFECGAFNRSATCPSSRIKYLSLLRIASRIDLPPVCRRPRPFLFASVPIPLACCQRRSRRPRPCRDGHCCRSIRAEQNY